MKLEDVIKNNNKFSFFLSSSSFLFSSAFCLSQDHHYEWSAGTQGITHKEPHLHLFFSALNPFPQFYLFRCSSVFSSKDISQSETQWDFTKLFSSLLAKGLFVGIRIKRQSRSLVLSVCWSRAQSISDFA